MLDNKKICSISDVSNISGFSAHTLRFYEKIGLMPFVKRSASGKRIYDEYDVQILKSISVFKKTGMTNKQIKDLGSLYLEGNKKVKEQRNLLLSHKEDITKKIDELSEALDIIEEKLEKSCFL